MALPAKEFMSEAKQIWEELGLPALTVKAPWHGFSLGDWSETWERFAQRATASAWEENGKETLARQRGGLLPETLVRGVEERKA